MTKVIPCLYSVQLLCPTYVRKFIQARYELKENESWTPHKSDRIGKMFVSLLERAPRRLEKYKPMPDGLNVKIMNDYYARKGCHLSQDSMDDFNSFIRLELVEQVAQYEKNLKDEIGKKKYDQVWMRKSADASAKIVQMPGLVIHQLFEKREIMYDLLATFGITEDDFAYETLKKATYRLKLHQLSA